MRCEKCGGLFQYDKTHQIRLPHTEEQCNQLRAIAENEEKQAQKFSRWENIHNREMSGSY